MITATRSSTAGTVPVHRGADTDVYQAVEALNVGDTIDVAGFLYWYQGANPHITSVVEAQ